jgi:hypothetical protein
MFELPTSIEIQGQLHDITNKGDYRMVLDCFEVLEDITLTDQERMLCCLIIFYDELNEIDDIDTVFGENFQEAVEKMFVFFNYGKPQSQSLGMKMNHKLVNWDKDSDMIASAVNNVAGKEVRLEPYIHWWTFLGYYMAIGDCLFANVIHIRNKILKGEKLEKYEQKFKRDNPDYFNWDSRTLEQKKDDLEGQLLWNSGR